MQLFSRQIFPSQRGWRTFADQLARRGFILLAAMPVLFLILILVVLVSRASPIFRADSLWRLLSGTVWLPGEGKFGFLPFILGTAWVTVVAMVLAVPPCVLTAIYLAEFAHPRLRTAVKPLLDLLAAIPSVVYGMWGVIAIVPMVQAIGPKIGKVLGFIPFFAANNPTGYSILAGGIVLAIMVSPFIIAIAHEVLRTIPDGYREASLAIGATRWETIKYAVLPKALSGIMAGIVLGGSRALGETMAVLMVVGNVVKIPTSVFDPAYPLPALIANNYGELLSFPLDEAALMTAALILLLVVLVINVLSILALRRMVREGYS